MRLLMGLSKKIDTLNNGIGTICSYLIVPLTLFVVYEVFTRAFKHPTIWTFEMSNFIFGAYFMLAAAYGLLHKSHVSIDLFSGRLSKRTQAICSLIGYLFMYFPFLAVLLIFGTSYANTSWQMLEKSWSIWGPPIYPVKTIIPVTAVLLFLQGGSEVIKDINTIIQNEGRSTNES